MERSRWLVILTALLAMVAGWYLIGEMWKLAQLFADIILLFFLAWLIAFVLSPMANFVSRLCRLPRIAGVVMVYAGLLLVLLIAIVLLVPTVTMQLSQLGTNLAAVSNQLPYWVADAQSELANRNINVDLTGIFRPDDLPNQIGNIGTLLVQNTINIVTGVASAVFAIVLVLVISFYFMADDGRLMRQIVVATPGQVRSELEFMLECVNRSFGGFIRGQLIQCGIYGAGTAIIMIVAGVDYVLLSSLFAAAVMLVPFFGPFLAIIPPIMIAALQGSFARVIIVTVALVLLQQIVINVVAPKVLGDAVGLPPLLVILSLLIGAKVAGLAGALFAVPVAAVLYAFLLLLYRRSPLPAHARRPSRGSIQADDERDRTISTE